MNFSRFSCLSLAILLFAGCASGSSGRLFSYATYDDTPAEARAYSDFMIARVAALTNDPETAANRYAAAINTAPERSGVAERAVFSALLAGNYGSAVGLSRRAEEAGSRASLVRLTLGVDAFRRGRAPAAAAYLDQREFRPFNAMVARGISAWSVLDTQGAEAAETFLLSGLTGDPRLDSATLYMMGLVQAAAGNDTAALATFEVTWTTGARLAIGVEAHAGLAAAMGKSDRALELIDAFTGQIGANPGLAALKARILAGETIPPKRLTVRQGAALAIYVPATALMSQTDDDLSAVYFVLALALDPELDVARTLWAEALHKAERTEEAIEVLAAIPSGSDFYATARGQMANMMLGAGRGEEALRVAGDALAATPDRSLRLQIADLYRQLERYEETETLVTQLIQEDAARGVEDYRLVLTRGAVRERLGNWPDAEADLKRALVLQPNNATVLNYLGYSWIDRGINLDEGLELIQRAVQIEPNSGHIVDSLGWAYFKLGDFDLAITYLERAVDLMPGDPILNDHLGDAYWRVGRYMEAGFQWRRALKLEPAADDRKRIETKLAVGLPELQSAGGPASVAPPPL